MPGMGGVRAIEQIMRSRPVPILVVSGARRPAPTGRRGAGGRRAGGDPQGRPAPRRRPTTCGRRRCAAASSAWPACTLDRMPRGGRIGASRAAARRSHQARERDRHRRVDRRAAGARDVLDGLPADFPLPVLVVQHIAAGFTVGLVAWLDRPGRHCPCASPRTASPPRPGVWFAPDDAHLRPRRVPLRLSLDCETRSRRRTARPSTCSSRASPRRPATARSASC